MRRDLTPEQLEITDSEAGLVAQVEQVAAHRALKVSVVGAGGGGAVPVGGAPALNYQGASAAVGVGATVTLVSAAVVDYELRGFIGTGEADGVWRLLLDGTELYATRTNIVQQNASLLLPVKDVVTGLLELKVMNEGLGVSAFSGVVIGEA